MADGFGQEPTAPRERGARTPWNLVRAHRRDKRWCDLRPRCRAAERLRRLYCVVRLARATSRDGAAERAPSLSLCGPAAAPHLSSLRLPRTPEGHTNLRSSSSDKLVLMDEATEEIVPSNPEGCTYSDQSARPAGSYRADSVWHGTPRDELGRHRDPRRVFGILHPSRAMVDYADCLWDPPRCGDGATRYPDRAMGCIVA